MKRAKFVIDLSKDRQYFFTLVAPNGKVIATSEMYLTHEGIMTGINSVRLNALIAKVEDKTGAE